MTNEELVYLYQQGDNTALNKLIEQNKRIVYKLVNKFYVEGTNSIDKEDLEQEGFIGLITAADRYDFDNEKKAQFMTYAVQWIYSKISRFVNTRCTNEEASLNAPINEDGDNELMDYIEGVDYSFENIEEKIYYQQLHTELDQVMDEQLTLKQRQIIKFHYGWDSKTMTLAEIGDMFNINGERIRQIESKAIRNIRRSTWGRSKAIELFRLKKKEAAYSIPGTMNSISFAEKYLCDEVM